MPGFQFRQADLYRLPEPPHLVVDDVYNHFISPYLRAELAIQRAEEEQVRAEAESARAQQERKRADRYAAKLAELGITLDDDA